MTPPGFLYLVNSCFSKIHFTKSGPDRTALETTLETEAFDLNVPNVSFFAKKSIEFLEAFRGILVRRFQEFRTF